VKQRRRYRNRHQLSADVRHRSAATVAGVAYGLGTTYNITALLLGSRDDPHQLGMAERGADARRL
jgi:hypothetical protein